MASNLLALQPAKPTDLQCAEDCQALGQDEVILLLLCQVNGEAGLGLYISGTAL